MAVAAIHTRDAAQRLADAHRNPFQTKALLNRLVRAGVIPALGKVGPGERSSWQFDRRTVMAAAVIFDLMDYAGITDAPRLRLAFDHLTGGEVAIIDECVNAIEDGREPVLVATLWTGPGRPITSYAVRFDSENVRKVTPPQAGYAPAANAVLWLTPTLAPFLDDEAA